MIARRFFSLALFLFFLSNGVFYTFSSSGTVEYDEDLLFDDVDESYDSSQSWVTRAGGAPTLGEHAQALPFFFKKPVWKKTAPTHTRNIIDLVPIKNRFEADKDVSVHIYYNKTDSLATTVGKGIDLSIIDPSQESILFQLLSVNEDQLADAARYVALLKAIAVEERNIGTLLRCNWVIGAFSFQALTTVAISERNLITSNKARKEITAILERNFGASKFFDEEREFARLKMGIGDTRLNFGVRTLDFPDFKMNVGGSVLMPTSKGILLDGYFKKPPQTKIEVPVIGLDLSFLLDDLRSVLLEPELGGNGHFRLGAYWESQLELFEGKMFWWNRASFDYLFSAYENRIFMNKQTLPADEDVLGTDPDLIAEFELQYVVPRSLEARVRPGNVFMFSSGVEHAWKRWRIGYGYDFYLSQREEIERIKDNQINLADLNIRGAVADPVIQHKLLLEASYNNLKEKMPLIVSLGGDYTFAKSGGAGFDWTVYFKAGWSF